MGSNKKNKNKSKTLKLVKDKAPAPQPAAAPTPQYTKSPEIHNALIKATFLGFDKGVTTCMIDLVLSNGQATFGGYKLDEPAEDAGKGVRIGLVFGMEYIRGLLSVLGIPAWEKLQNTYCRVRIAEERVLGVGNLLTEQWFFPHLLHAQLIAREVSQMAPVLSSLQASKDRFIAMEEDMLVKDPELQKLIDGAAQAIAFVNTRFAKGS